MIFFGERERKILIPLIEDNNYGDIAASLIVYNHLKSKNLPVSISVNSAHTRKKLKKLIKDEPLTEYDPKDKSSLVSILINGDNRTRKQKKRTFLAVGVNEFNFYNKIAKDHNSVNLLTGIGMQLNEETINAGIYCVDNLDALLEKSKSEILDALCQEKQIDLTRFRFHDSNWSMHYSSSSGSGEHHLQIVKNSLKVKKDPLVIFTINPVSSYGCTEKRDSIKKITLDYKFNYLRTETNEFRDSCSPVTVVELDNISLTNYQQLYSGMDTLSIITGDLSLSLALQKNETESAHPFLYNIHHWKNDVAYHLARIIEDFDPGIGEFVKAYNTLSELESLNEIFPDQDYGFFTPLMHDEDIIKRFTNASRSIKANFIRKREQYKIAKPDTLWSVPETIYDIVKTHF